MNVLIAEDERILREILKKDFTSAGFDVQCADNGETAIALIEHTAFDVVVSDMKMPGKSGNSVIRAVRARWGANTLVIIMTAFADIEGAVAAVKLGADDYFAKPFDIQHMIEKIKRILHSRAVCTQAQHIQDPASPLIYRSPVMAKVAERIEKIRDLPSTVLITGESGTGKGVLAREIHRIGNRSQAPFVQLDCASFNANLIESELFGYEKGAFTSANQSREGKLELAKNGIIFLDEIGNIPLNLQAKLLLVLQDRSFYRVGGNRQHYMNARVIAATNANLAEAVAQKQFREDLFYRLNVVTIEAPPLRSRKEDIPLLTASFFQRFKRAQGKNDLVLDDGVLDILGQYDWPGNIRELENAMESAVALCDGRRLTADDLPSRVRVCAFPPCREIQGCLYPQASPPEDEELKKLLAALDKFDGHREKTAAYLGITRRALQYKLKKYHLTNRS